MFYLILIACPCGFGKKGKMKESCVGVLVGADSVLLLGSLCLVTGCYISGLSVRLSSYLVDAGCFIQGHPWV